MPPAAGPARRHRRRSRPRVVQLRVRQEQLTGKLQSMLGRLGPSHPDVQSLRAASSRRTAACDQRRDRPCGRGHRSGRARRSRARGRTGAGPARRAGSVGPRFAGADPAERACSATPRHRAACCSRCWSACSRPHSNRRSKRRMRMRSRWRCRRTQPSFPRTVPLMAAAVAFGVLFGLLLVYLCGAGGRHLPQRRRYPRASLGLPCLALIRDIRRRSAGAHEHRGLCRPQAAVAVRRAASRAAGRSVAVAGPAAHRRDNRGAARARARPPLPWRWGASTAMNGERVIVLDCDIRQPTTRAVDADGQRPAWSTACWAGHARRCHPQGRGHRHGRTSLGGTAGGQCARPVDVGHDGAPAADAARRTTTSCCSMRRRRRR